MESIIGTLSVGVVFGGLILIFFQQMFGSKQADSKGSKDGGGDAELPHIESGADSSSGDGDGGGSSD